MYMRLLQPLIDPSGASMIHRTGLSASTVMLGYRFGSSVLRTICISASVCATFVSVTVCASGNIPVSAAPCVIIASAITATNTAPTAVIV